MLLVSNLSSGHEKLEMLSLECLELLYENKLENLRKQRYNYFIKNKTITKYIKETK